MRRLEPSRIIRVITWAVNLRDTINKVSRLPRSFPNSMIAEL